MEDKEINEIYKILEDIISKQNYKIVRDRTIKYFYGGYMITLTFGNGHEEHMGCSNKNVNNALYMIDVRPSERFPPATLKDDKYKIYKNRYV